MRLQTGRRELGALLLAGAAGAGLAAAATRLQVARVVVQVPHPLPVTTTAVNGQALLPAVAPLAVAALASLAAVVATRGLLRRVTGLVTAALGLGIAVSAAAGVSAAQVLAAAAHANISPSTGAGGGIAPGSTTTGADGSRAIGSLAGFPAHVVFAGSAWRLTMVVGAILIAGVGLAIIALGPRLPVMSARYERTPHLARVAGAGPSAAVPAAGVPAAAVPAAAVVATAGSGAAAVTMARGGAGRGDSASMWESLSAGADPTSSPADDDEAD